MPVDIKKVNFLVFFYDQTPELYTKNALLQTPKTYLCPILTSLTK